MDIARPSTRRPVSRRMIAGAVITTFIAVWWWRAPAANEPSVSLSALLIDTVQAGEMVFDVRATGVLASERMHFITAGASARVERVHVQSGSAVVGNAVLLELSNPDLRIQSLEAEQRVRQARMDLLTLQLAMRSQSLSQELLVASAETQLVDAQQESDAAQALGREGLAPDFEVRTKTAVVKEATTRQRVEAERLRIMRDAIASQVAMQESRIQQLVTIADSYAERLRSLVLRAPESGVVQDLTVQLGQWVPEGSTVAKIVQLKQLKAILRVPEGQAKDVRVGEVAHIDTHNGVVPGRVIRKEPSAQGGSVAVDVALDGVLPAGAVPDINVDAVIELARVPNAMFVGRPSLTTESSHVSLFRISENAQWAERVPVELGRLSSTIAEITSGLQPGDRIILSDMSEWSSASRIRLINRE